MSPTWVARFLFFAGSASLTLFFTILHSQTTEFPYEPFGTNRFWWTILFFGAFMTAAYSLGLPDVPADRTSAISLSLGAVLLAIVSASLLQLVLGVPLLPRLVLGGSSSTMLIWSILCWQVQSDVDQSRAEQVFVIAEQSQMADLESELLAGSERPLQIAGFLESSTAAESEPTENKVIHAVNEASASLVVMDVSAQASATIISQVTSLHRDGVRIRTVSLFAEEFLGKIPLADMERTSLLFDIGELHRTLYVRSKRVLDLFLGLIAIPILAVAVPIVLVGNLLANRGPLFFSQPRVGKDGHVFRIYKFRTMVEEGDSTSWTTESDDRVTGFGRYLRRSHVDELPQVLNIVKGDLSVVGPRPEQPDYVAELSTKIPYFDVRNLVRPGLTGWAQVKYPYGANEADAREKLQFDLYYLRRQSLLLDLRIVVRTLRSVARGGGQ